MNLRGMGGAIPRLLVMSLVSIFMFSGCAREPVESRSLDAAPAEEIEVESEASASQGPTADDPESLSESLPDLSPPSRERVIACRKAESAFAASPAPLVIEENGKTSRVPTREEVAAYEEAWQSALDLAKAEPELSQIATILFARMNLLRAAESQDQNLIRQLSDPGVEIENLDGSVQDEISRREALNAACAEVGSLTDF